MAVVRSERPELVLMDIQLPGMDGIETLRELRRSGELAAAPIVAVTAFVMKEDRERFLAPASTGTWKSRSISAPCARCVDSYLGPGGRGAES